MDQTYIQHELRTKAVFDQHADKVHEQHDSLLGNTELRRESKYVHENCRKKLQFHFKYEKF